MTEATDAGRKTILCVDDDPHMLSALRRLFHTLPYDTLTAGSGEEALQVTQEIVPDLIILDLMMPGMDGLEVLRHLRALGMAETPVVMLTAKQTRRAMVRSRQQGAVCFITKPFRQDEVLNTIRRLIGKREEEERK